MRRTTPRLSSAASLAGRHGLLKRHGAAYCLDGAGELDQDPISHDLDNSAVVLGYQWLKDFRAAGLQHSERASFVSLHHSAVTNHIGGQDGGEATVRRLF
jgi:hypothetical protein